MNCAECRDNLVACAEGLLDRGTETQCRAHLSACAACHAEFQTITRLQKRLIARGLASASIQIVRPVMNRIHRERFKPERETIMSKLLKHRWGFGLGAAAAAAAVTMSVILLTMPKAQARAEEVMSEGAQAVAQLTSIHLRGQLRTAPADNFGYINADSPFYTIELWKQFTPQLKWRVEKPGRVAVMDGTNTTLYIKEAKMGFKIPQAASSAFDTDWLQRIASLSNTLSNELNNARSKGWKLTEADETGSDGRAKSVVTVLATPGVPDNDYVKNSFIENANTRRVYRFDSDTKRLEAVQIYLDRPSGEVQIFDLSEITYDQPIDAGEFQLALPDDVNWVQTPKKLPDNEKYARMTATEAARAFFEACSRKDWDEAGKFYSPITPQVKEYLGGLELVSLGKEFTSKAYGGKFVPYEIKLPVQEFNFKVSNDNAAKRYVMVGVYDSHLKLEQDLKSSVAPEVLTNNDDYAKLSPKEAVQAYVNAQAAFNWDEMRKFTSQEDVDQTKGQVDQAEKQGADVHKDMPTIVVGDAFWSEEQSAWLVKCHMTAGKKWNLAVRNDNPAHRWQVDGGF